MTGFLERVADVIDGEILFAQSHDALANRIRPRGGARSLGGREEEGTLGLLSELGAQDAEAPWGVAEAPRRLV